MKSCVRVYFWKTTLSGKDKSSWAEGNSLLINKQIWIMLGSLSCFSILNCAHKGIRFRQEFLSLKLSRDSNKLCPEDDLDESVNNWFAGILSTGMQLSSVSTPWGIGCVKPEMVSYFDTATVKWRWVHHKGVGDVFNVAAGWSVKWSWVNQGKFVKWGRNRKSLLKHLDTN